MVDCQVHTITIIAIAVIVVSALLALTNYTAYKVGFTFGKQSRFLNVVDEILDKRKEYKNDKVVNRNGRL